MAVVCSIAGLNLTLSPAVRSRALRAAEDAAVGMAAEAAVVERRAERFVGPVIQAAMRGARRVEARGEAVELHGAEVGGQQQGARGSSAWVAKPAPPTLEKHDQGDFWMTKERTEILANNSTLMSTASWRGPFVTDGIPDTRNPACKRAPLNDFPMGKLAHFSVVIPYHRESLRTMSLTIRSLLANSPAALLDEIIFVDDDNKDPAVKAQLLRFPKVRVVSAPKRIGLIAAKNLGASSVKSSVVIFLESHVQTNVFWAEHLLARLAACPHCIVLPVTDIIDDNTLKYHQGGDGVRGGFGWDLQFKWINNPADGSYTAPAPLATPAMSGGLLAMTMREWDRLGHYDGKMQIWGGENVEMSLRVWRCGGRIEIIPCSRVGHVFRSPENYGKWKDNFPYSFPVDDASVTVEHNIARLARVWLEKPFLERYYRRAPKSQRLKLDVRGRLALKKRLKCKPMKWFLKEIYPELGKQH